MDGENLNILEKLLPPSYAKQALEASNARENKIKWLLTQQRLPEQGWDDLTIELFLNKMSSMDSNNFPNSIGVGEREGRFASDLVAKRHYNFCHGIGRSGDLLEAQPKAAGSTLINKLTNILLIDLMRTLGIRSSTLECMLVPVATGMSMVLSLLTIRQMKPTAKYVIWSRIDQKSCFKSISTAGFQPVVIELSRDEYSLRTDLESLEFKINVLGADNIACIITTTSCFAPRVCDNIEEVAKIARKHKLFHVINNAYGVQSRYFMERIQKAKKAGRVDLFVQSTDKNLMVPVGGSIIAGFNKELMTEISKTYPGRASFTPTLDVIITLLSLGKEGYINLLNERDDMFKYLNLELEKFAKSIDEKVLVTTENNISIAMTLTTMKEQDLTKFGSMLFTRNVTGARVVTTADKKKIKDHVFEGWGSHCNDYQFPYITAASAVGIKKSDIDRFIGKLGECYSKLKTNKDVELQCE